MSPARLLYAAAMSELVIRAATDADRATAIALLQALNIFENTVSGDRREDLQTAAAHLDVLLAKLAETGGELLLAQRGGAVLGLVAWGPEEDDVYVVEKLRRLAVVHELIVVEPARRQGIGQALLAEAEARARRAGLKRLLIGALVGNQAAEAAYASFGFRPYVTKLVKPLD
jgi:GNAT superfamily N-acetyltransferase